ncbi:MAG TPA: 50S ribosomal protein L25 [Verrucomicrobiota bacterium]|nr:50S ribosomal protein L25 [Verrucomicrobiota bacterium]HNU49612.1 50S ribosomal protein L25 [Verrucomicrobiota bacterium]
MKSEVLTAYPRTAARRSGVKKLRASFRVPAVIYGRRRQPQNLEVKLKELEDLIHRSVAQNILLDLKVEGDAEPGRLALLQQVQHHPVSGKILHVDFHEVAADERVVIQVPVETAGEAIGVKTGGGILEHVLFSLKVRGLPKDLPEVLVVDVSHLEVGQAIHISDIQAPPGVQILGEKSISVIAVSAPPTEAEEAAAAAVEEGAPLEPEVIKEKKDEEEAASPAAGGKAGEKAPEKGADKGAVPEKKEKAEKKK